MEAIAETMIGTDETPPPINLGYRAPEQIDYLPQHKISILPVLPEDQIVRATIYPPIAQRSNIEGVVYLELFIDPQGNVRDVRILRETPQGRGFGEAAVNAFKGIRGKPAQANGAAVAVRYRYNINFKLN
jgi:protein TonB